MERIDFFGERIFGYDKVYITLMGVLTVTLVAKPSGLLHAPPELPLLHLTMCANFVNL